MPTTRPIAVAARVVAVAGLALLLLAGCARDSGDWRSAQDADTQEAYEAFLARHPQSEFAPKAKERTAQLVEERDWGVATQEDAPEAYQTFIGQHPDGKWTQEARIRVENFNVIAASASAPEVAMASAGAAPDVAAASKAAAAEGTAPRPSVATPSAATTVAAAAQARARAPASVLTPRAAPAPVAPAARAQRPRGPDAAAASGAGHRVQLGALSSAQKAEAEWSRVRQRFAALRGLEPRITPVQTASGRLYRLQADVADAASARTLCETLKAGGQACLYVPPR